MEAIVTKSITSLAEGVIPPANIPRVEDPILATPLLATVASPKSVAFAKFATFTKSIVFIFAGETNPQADNPLVSFERLALARAATVASPKSVALDVVAIVTKSIVLAVLEPPVLPPPDHIARVDDPNP